MRTERKTAYNSTFAIGGVSCSVDSFVVTESLVLRYQHLCLKARPSQICKPLAAILHDTTHTDNTIIQTNTTT
jgi:asparagine synthetase A